jgi:hypothetical protein
MEPNELWKKLAATSETVDEAFAEWLRAPTRDVHTTLIACFHRHAARFPQRLGPRQSVNATAFIAI